MDSKTYKSQLRRTYEAFLKAPKTMKAVSVETGIMRANICRYIATLRKSNKVAVVKFDRCPITRHKAGFLTTNPELFPKKDQRDLFND